MYTRSYYPDNTARPPLPDNYDGCAFRDEAPPVAEGGDTAFEAACAGCSQPHAQHEYMAEKCGQNSLLGGLFGSGGLLGGLNLRMPTIGTEEILIIAMAAFLFFSKWGDKESAVMLLLLLLVN